MNAEMMESMVKMQLELAYCKAKSNNLYRDMLPGLTEMGYTTTNNSDVHTFRVYHEDSKYGVSVSVPPDCNKCDSNYVYYETALWDKSLDKLVYNEYMGYDCCLPRFSSTEELFTELERVRNFPHNNQNEEE